MTADQQPDGDEQQHQVQHALDAMDRMANAVEGLEGYVLTSNEVRTHTGRYRVNLLWLHCIFTLALAPLFAATPPEALQGPAFAYLVAIPGTPWSEAVLLWIGGIILGFGCVFRAKRTEAIGLALLALFYLVLTVCFTLATFHWATAGGKATTLYAPIVYLHFAMVMCTHIYGVLMSRTDDRRFASLRGE